MKTIYSAIQPSGIMTLGNYIGAVDNWHRMQADANNKCIFALADLHTITVRQDPQKFHENAMSFYALLLALGIDPKKSIVYFQSHVQEHAYLSWLLNCYTMVGEMNRMTQFKDKSQKHADNVNMGLMDYPVLMAADILLYNTDEVPVGYDQLQHIEIARDIAERVNGIYGDIFTIPKGVLTKVGAKVMSLQDPLSKMSKSDPNPKSYISVLDDDATIMKKFKSAVTDSETEIRFDPENKPGVSNLLTILAVAQNKSIDEVVKDFDGLMYGHLKVRTGEAVCEMLKPMKEEYNRLIKDEAYLMKCAKEGAEQAHDIAIDTLNRFKKAIGFVTL
ncbi:MAG: tryptophan--tRNA ligase [Clostridiales bacterium]|nr:tryptophan--tRNA ligase [Clostridiales bacterium]